jgi:hypothetical protein
MTDHELLKLAKQSIGVYPFAGIWNPLEDDGDAFRLAVDLKLLISVSDWSSKATDGLTVESFEPATADRRADTRRAIVRAAAEIGRTSE